MFEKTTTDLHTLSSKELAHLIAVDRAGTVEDLYPSTIEEFQRIPDWDGTYWTLGPVGADESVLRPANVTDQLR